VTAWWCSHGQSWLGRGGRRADPASTNTHSKYTVFEPPTHPDRSYFVRTGGCPVQPWQHQRLQLHTSHNHAPSAAFNRRSHVVHSPACRRKRTCSRNDSSLVTAAWPDGSQRCVSASVDASCSADMNQSTFTHGQIKQATQCKQMLCAHCDVHP
jgi:hypothetical protein